jgi:hypothetical protein
MFGTSLKTSISALVIAAALVAPVQRANAGEMMMGGGGGGGGAGFAALGAGLALGLVTSLIINHHADAENNTTGRRVDCIEINGCHVHIVRQAGQAPEAHVWQEPPRNPPRRAPRVPARPWAQSYDPETGLTTTSVSNGNGQHIIVTK